MTSAPRKKSAERKNLRTTANEQYKQHGEHSEEERILSMYAKGMTAGVH